MTDQEKPIPEILAVRPSGTQTKIHLYIVGYQPGAKPRNPPDVALCNGTGSIHRNELVPLRDALDWTKPHGPCEHCHTPRPDWEWCHLCLGRAIGVAGLADDLAKTIASRTEKTNA